MKLFIAVMIAFLIVCWYMLYFVFIYMVHDFNVYQKNKKNENEKIQKNNDPLPPANGSLPGWQKRPAVRTGSKKMEGKEDEFFE